MPFIIIILLNSRISFFINSIYLFIGSLYLVKHCSHIFFDFINMIFLSYFEYILNS